MKNKSYRSLYLLMLVSLLNIFFMMKFGISSNIRYIGLILNIIILVFSKEEDLLPIIFFTRPNFALYDSCGFKYFFNLTVVLVALKLLFLYKKGKNISKKSVVLLSILFLYNAFLTVINDVDMFYLLTYVSLFLSYIILIIYSKEQNIDFKKIYVYYFFGMIMGALCGIFIPISTFGLTIPSGYRFAGLMRDSNGYSLEILLLIISSSIYAKITNKSSLPYVLILIFLGCLGISKMFIICLFIVLIYKLLFSRKEFNIKKFNMKSFIICVLSFIVLIILNSKYNFIDMFKDNYLTRFASTDLTSGRNDITNYYIRLLFNNPLLLFFGKGLEYYKIIGYGGWAQAHNTWLELPLSFGIIGTILYLVLIIGIIKSKTISKPYYFKSELILSVIVFSLCIGALPILAGDALAILILYIIVIKNIDYRGEKNEKNQNS